MSVTIVLEELRTRTKTVVLEKSNDNFPPFKVTVQTRRRFHDEEQARAYFENQKRKKVDTEEPT